MNKFFNSVLRDSLIMSPFASLISGSADPWSVGIDAAGSLLGFINNERTNAINLKIARETNAQQYKMFQEQMDYQTGIWNKANEYNSPTAQSKRLAAAGINPAAVLANGSAVTDVSSPSAPSAPQMHAPTMQGYDVGGSVSRVLNDYLNQKNINSQTRLIDEQSAQQHFQNEIAFSRWEMEQKERAQNLARQILDYEHEKEKHPKDMAHIQGMIDLLSSQKNDIEEEIRYKRESFDERQRSLKLGNDLTEEKIESEKIHRAYEESMSQKALADAGLSRATANRIWSLLPYDKQVARNQGYFADQEIIKHVISGFKNKTEMREYAESVAREASLNIHDKIDYENFHNWYTRFIVPTLGAAAPIITAFVFKKIPKPKK